METCGLYKFKIIELAPGNWVYEIHHPHYPELPPLRESNEWFESQQEARFAAIGHISLLENGEG